MNSKYYFVFDSITNLYHANINNGKRFVDLLKPESSKEYRFFISEEFTEGNIVFENQPYYKIPLKYDILEDNIILHQNNVLGGHEVILNPIKIDNFQIFNKTFVKLPSNASNFSFYENGFFEQLMVKEKYILYSKIYKLKFKKFLEKKIVYRFNQHQYYVLNVNSHYYKIKTKRDLIKIFPEYKKVITKFYNENSILEKSNKSQFFINLLQNL